MIASENPFGERQLPLFDVLGAAASAARALTPQQCCIITRGRQPRRLAQTAIAEMRKKSQKRWTSRNNHDVRSIWHLSQIADNALLREDVNMDSSLKKGSWARIA